LFDAENFHKHTAVKTVTLQHELPRLLTKNKSDAFFLRHRVYVWICWHSRPTPKSAVWRKQY